MKIVSSGEFRDKQRIYFDSADKSYKLVDIIRDSTVLKRKDNATLIKLQELEEKKIKLKVAPVLWLDGAGTNHKGKLKIDLNNKREKAIVDDFIVKSGEIEIHSKTVPWDLEKGEKRYIFARNKSERYLNNVKYEIVVLYHDGLNNNFSLLISGKGAIVKIISNDEINE